MHLELGIIVFIVMLLLIVLRMPIAISMLITGAFGFGYLTSWDALMNHMKDMAYSRAANYSLSVIPLFVLMGLLAANGGISQAAYRSARAWLGHFRGGLAIATIGGCAAFGAICGSAIATGATMTTAALPEMRRCGYSGALSTGSLAVGGTLGILIPPSIILVIVGLITEQSIGDLFIAAFIPGIIATAGYMMAIMIYVRLRPEAGPAAAPESWEVRFASLNAIWPVVAIFLIVIGGIYWGVFTPTEGAAVGTVATALFASAFGELRLKEFKRSVLEMAGISGMIFLILIDAEIYSSFLALSQIPQALAGWITSMGFAPYTILLTIIAIYIFLGAIMDEIGMILLTVPVFYPIIMDLDFGMSPAAQGVWFGILLLTVVEVGLILPPIGLNVFVINAMAKDVPLMETYKGIVPFFMSDLVRIGIIILVPATCTWLPGL